ncbi:thiamine phosphate synthase [Herpetosiphon gulosus]
MMQIDWRLYAVLDTATLGLRDPLTMTAALLAGGIGILQLRAKNLTVRQTAQLAQAILPLTRIAQIPLLINDDLGLALALGADGVHLGVDDLPLDLARASFKGLIGYSPEGVTDAQRAEKLGVDYLGVGPFAATSTKLDAGAPLGHAGLRAIVEAVDCPVLAIGGITQHNVAEVRACGVAGIVVVSALLNATNPTQACREFLAD